MTQRARTAFTLLEVIVALTLLGIAGSALLLASAQSQHAVNQAQRFEHRHQRVARLLTELALTNDSTLSSLIGRRVIREHLVVVSRGERGGFHIEVAERPSGIILRTTVYRGIGGFDDR